VFIREGTGRTDVLCCFTLTRKAFSCFGIKLSCQSSRHESAARSVMGGRSWFVSVRMWNVGLLYLRPGYTTSQFSLYYNSVFCSERSRDSSIHIVTLLWAGRTKNRLSILDSNKILIYRVIQRDWLNFLHLYFLNYTRYVNDLHNIWKRKS